MLEETRPENGRARGLVSSRASGQRIEARTFAPPPALRDTVASLWITRWDLRYEPSHVAEILAAPCQTIAFEAQRSRFVGLSTGLFRRELVGCGFIRAIQLKAGAGRALTDVPMAALTNRRVPFRRVFPGAPANIEERILEAADDVNGLTRAVEWLQGTARSICSDPNVSLAIRVVEHIAQNPELLTVEAVAKASGLAPRPLQRLFRDYVGASPKWIVRRFRLQEAAVRIERGDISLTELAAELGYADLAHLSRDFKAAAGRTPTELARQR
jgi:AraC-like DNA-binding protein